VSPSPSHSLAGSGRAGSQAGPGLDSECPARALPGIMTVSPLTWPRGGAPPGIPGPGPRPSTRVGSMIMKAIVASHETPCQWQRPPSSRAGPGRCSAAAAALTQPAARPGCRGHWQPECHWQGLSSRSLSSAGHWHWQPVGGACGLAHRGLRGAQSQSSRAASPRSGPAAPGRPLKGGFKACDSNFCNPAARSFRSYSVLSR